MTKSAKKPLSIEKLPQGVSSEETPDGLVLTIPDHGTFEAVVPVRVVSSGAKLRVKAGKTARARFSLIYETPANFEAVFELESGAYVDVFHLDQGARGGKLESRNVYRLKKHSSLNACCSSAAGSADVRHEVKFLEEHGFAAVRGLSLLGGDADVVHRVIADHASGHCVSRQFYKSVVAQNAKAIFESLVRVAKGAVKSDSNQLNKNLLLSKTALAVSRPELRISADDVSCAHGSATGELNFEELFYMKSRGIEESAARFMMTEGFAAEILQDIPAIPVRKELEQAVKGRIVELAA